MKHTFEQKKSLWGACGLKNVPLLFGVSSSSDLITSGSGSFGTSSLSSLPISASSTIEGGNSDFDFSFILTPATVSEGPSESLSSF